MKSPASDRAAAAKEMARARLERLEHGRRTGFVVDVTKRFRELGGIDQAGLLSIELFTTVIPLIVIGFAYLKGFAADTSPGEVLIRQMNVSGELAETVHRTFESSEKVRSVWTVAGLASFLFWGIPMSLTVSRAFSSAWRREQFPIGQRILRGFAWFLIYLLTIGVAIRINAVAAGSLGRVGLFMLAAVPYFLFWALTPVILIRDGSAGWRYLGLVGLIGMVVDSLVIRSVARIVFPLLLDGWTGFGPIGVAMALMTWCGVIAVGWIVTACAGAVMWERSAPTETVLAAQSA